MHCMIMKQIKINIPDGYEIDENNSTFECIKFKPKPQVYWSDEHQAVVVEADGEEFMIDADPTTVMNYLECRLQLMTLIHWKLPTPKQLSVISKHISDIDDVLLAHHRPHFITGTYWTDNENDDITRAVAVDTCTGTCRPVSVYETHLIKLVSEL